MFRRQEITLWLLVMTLLPEKRVLLLLEEMMRQGHTMQKVRDIY
ncbi:hypothetical protein P286_06580 [Salmonella enterica subsp. arizonae serovar 18:z4,z23:- str. CVM N4410]|nr:hypothetical protein P286_06580 [Salmonella enterica subsp. arizonae serovar 18:z4,z23:- str. CVM N4410]